MHMKGYATVKCDVAMKARYNYINWFEETEKLLEELILKYYEQEYAKQSKIGKWWNKDKTPKEFLHSRIKPFDTYDEELYKVSTSQEIKAIHLFSYAYQINEYSRSIRQLCSASSDGKIMVDQTLAGFIETWGEVK